MGLLAFACYDATLLPGLDFGDTASFQTGIGWWLLTPRQAYPLYFGLGDVFVWLVPGEPAHALNLASAVYGALAAAVAMWVAAALSGSVLGGVAAGLLLAFSYTFWSQAIIAEVYTLHLLLLGISLATLLAWSQKPTLRRLALFYAVYALGFGNHLSTVLLLPGFTAFILLHRKPGPDDPLRPRAIALAIGIAALGALQYSWNFRGMWLVDPVPSTLPEGLGKFWFDVTKSDWRQSLVATVSAAGLQDRPAMYWFDIHQQFGAAGVVLAVIGIFFVAARSWRAAVLLMTLYAANMIFAWYYNVGDVHVFFLPSHYIVALCAGAGVAAVVSSLAAVPRSRRLRLGYAAASVAFSWVLWRGYDTFPALDRSWDRRPEHVLADFTSFSSGSSVPPGVDRAVFGIDVNWQVQNALEYFERQCDPGLTWFSLTDLEWLSSADAEHRVQKIVQANRDAGRSIIVTPSLKTHLMSLGYPPGRGDTAGFRELAPFHPQFTQTIDPAKRGSFYALGILRPTKEFPINKRILENLLSFWTGNHIQMPQIRDYTIIVGEAGRTPLWFEAQDRPYRRQIKAANLDVDVRMESWLASDTIRRAGFGHVILGRRHALTLERGVSFIAFDELGNASPPSYEAGIFAPIPRLLVRLPGDHF